MKICKGPCGLKKELFEFTKDKNTKDGKSDKCRACQKIYRQEHKENFREAKRRYRSIQKNKDKETERKKQRYQEDEIYRERIKAKNRTKYNVKKDTINEKRRQRFQEDSEYRKKKLESDARYRETHKGEIKLGQHRYYEENKEEILIERKEYRQANRKKIAEYKRAYRKERRRTDVNYRLGLNLRSRINKAVKGNFKSGSAVQDLGCTIQEFKAYIESQFYIRAKTGEAMSWNNYGEWELDHIIPVIEFDLSDREQFLKACHYTNYQPLWWEDNVAKSDRLDWTKDKK